MNCEELYKLFHILKCLKTIFLKTKKRTLKKVARLISDITVDSVIHGLVLCLSPTQPSLLSPPAWADTSHTDPLCTRDSNRSSSASTARHSRRLQYITIRAAKETHQNFTPQIPGPSGWGRAAEKQQRKQKHSSWL